MSKVLLTTISSVTALCSTVFCVTTFCGTLAAAPISLFDGKTFTGWEGDTAKTWRIEEGVIAGGSLETTVPRNEFLVTEKSYQNFDLKLQYKLIGTEGFVNGGVQFWSQRVPNHHEMVGYQADIGHGYDGSLYDESRRKKFLKQADPEVIKTVLKVGEWNEYRIRAEGKNVRIWLNGTEVLNYDETEQGIPNEGHIGLQIHGNCKAVIRYKNITIEELPK